MSDDCSRLKSLCSGSKDKQNWGSIVVHVQKNSTLIRRCT